jgi:transposase
MEPVVLGIDVGKTDFYCAVLVDGKTYTNTFSSNLKGFERLVAWLTNRRIEIVHACMEATGGWSEEIGVFLHERNHLVSIVNPSAIKAFGACELSRTKTDKADAALIARYCVAMRPKTWQPPNPARRRLQRLTRRRTALVEMRTQETNRLESPGSSDVRASIETMIGFLEKQIAEIDEQISTTVNDDDSMRHDRALLESIPGIGKRVATTLLGEIPNIVEFRNGKQLAAFVGLCPREHQSGNRASRSWLAKSGNRHVRNVLYMPALTAMRHNPILSAFRERMYARGKRPMQIVAAVMRRLLVIAYGVLKSGKRFSATLSPS